MTEPEVPPKAETKTNIPARALWFDFSVFDSTVELTKGYKGAKNNPINGNRNETSGKSAIVAACWFGTLLAMGITIKTKIPAANNPKDAM